MDLSRIIIEFLSIQDFTIEDIKLFKKDLRAEVVVRQKRSECYCSRCGLEFKAVKEWVLKEIRVPPLGPFQKVNLKFWQMRGFCEDCHLTSVARVDWIHPQFHSMTCGFAERAGRLMEEITCQAVGRILDVDPKFIAPFLIGNFALSTIAFGQSDSNQLANQQTLKELTNRSNVLLLSNLVIRKNAIESYSSQKGSLVLKETIERIFQSLFIPAGSAGLIAYVSASVSLIRNGNEIDMKRYTTAQVRGSVWGAVFGFVATQYKHEVVQKLETQQIRKLKSMTDEEIAQEYAAVISEISRVSNLLDNSVKN